MDKICISIPKAQYNNKKEYLKIYQNERIKQRRSLFVSEMGSCYFCGSDECIEIHHVDPCAKESHKIFSWSDDRVKAELGKCIALCHDCHVKLHRINKLKPLEHGTLYAYQRYGCRCDLCRIANNDKNARQRKTKKCLTDPMPA